MWIIPNYRKTTASCLVPWLLAPGDALRHLAEEAKQAARTWNLRASVAVTPAAHPAFLDVLISHYQAALEGDSLLAPSWDNVLSEIAQGVGTYGHGTGRATAPEEETLFRELDRKINAMLPPHDRVRT